MRNSTVLGSSSAAWAMVLDHAWSAVLSATVHLGLIEALTEIAHDGGDVAASDVATRIGADGDAVNRLLRALAVRGLVDHVAGQRYRINQASASLRADGPTSVAPLLKIVEHHWDLWPHLHEAITSGRDVFAKLRGKPLFEYLTEVPDEARAFDAAQTRTSELVMEPLLDALELDEVRTVVDVAGGQGALLRGVLVRQPRARGVLFDLPSVVGQADSALVSGGWLAGRAIVVAGDFFTGVPGSADLYLLKHILHDWNDDDSARILTTIADSAPQGARVAVIDPVMGSDGPFEEFHVGLDLMMLLLFGGKERTEQEYAELFSRAGIDFAGVTPVDGGRLAIVHGRVRKPTTS